MKCKRIWCFLVALGIVGLATLIRFPCRALLRDATPFLFYLPAVVVVAVCFGRGPGILATVASALQANFFWMLPQNMFDVNPIESLDLLTFSVAGLAVSLLSERWHRERLAKEQLRATLVNAADGIITTDEEGRVVFLNATAQLLTGWVSDKVIGQAIGGVLSLMDERGDDLSSHRLQQALVNDLSGQMPKRLILVSKTGKRVRVEQTISRILDRKGRKTGTVIVFHQPDCEVREVSPL